MCLEMQNHLSGSNQIYGMTSPSYGLSTVTLPIETPLRQNSTNNSSSYSNFNNNNNNSNNNNGANNPSASNNAINNINNNSCNADLASVDSSDTYASCQTHPFLSQGDLTAADLADAVCDLDDIDMNNLYINPLEKDSAVVLSQVKKSASGDTALRNLGGSCRCDSPTDETFQPFQSSFDSRERSGSRVSLNETPVPKHRKTRFQQFAKPPKARFDIVASTKASDESLTESGKKNRRSSFMPTKSLASATKLINQHLFGIQNVNTRGLRTFVFFFFFAKYTA